MTVIVVPNFNIHVYIYITSAHTLARSLHDVSCVNNNRFAVVVCFKLHFMTQECDFFFLKFSSLKILYHYEDVINR